MRIHLWGRTGPDSNIFAPWWIDGRRRCYLRKASHYGELWEDVYPSWIRYKLKRPILNGEIQGEDIRVLQSLWGKAMPIL